MIDLPFAPDRVFRRDGFLSEAECAAIREAAVSGPTAAALVVRWDGTVEVDPEARQVDRCELSDDLVRSLTARFQAIRPDLEAWFRTPLGECEVPQVLVYHPGGHFVPHTDAGDGAHYPANVAGRVVTAVVFLNGQTLHADVDGYGGGTLNLYDLSPDADPRSVRYPVTGQPGTLVAFPSRWMHAVCPVQHGRRVTLVSWYQKTRL